MRKEIREIERIASELGISDAKVIAGDPHARLIGHVGGVAINIVVSLSKVFSCTRNTLSLRTNIRKAMREARKL